jgi:hypothetical protein
MIVHLASTNDIGLRAAVEAPARRPDGTWNIKLTVAVFRPWRGSQATIASDPAFDAAPWFAHPHRRLGEEFGPAIAGCWTAPNCFGTREPLTPRLARPNYHKKTGADGRDRTDDLRFTKPLLYQLSYIGQIASSLCHVCAAAQVNQSSTVIVTEGLPIMGRSSRLY